MFLRLTVAWFFLAAAFAAPATGTLDGRLTDSHSTPLPQATVVVRNLTTGETVRSVTGKNGVYRFTGLGPGEYRLEAEVPEIGKGAVEGIVISAGHATRVQAALVMEIPHTEEIALNPHMIDPVTPAVSTTIEADELNSIPLISRDWQAIEGTTPAASTISELAAENPDESESIGPGSDLAFDQGGGASPSSSVDGIAKTVTLLPARGAANQSSALGASAIDSFQVSTSNASGDSEAGPRGVANITTNRGSNDLHGQFFYLNQQSLWGALNPFTQWVQQTAPVNGFEIAQFSPNPYSPANSRHTFGLGIGSHIRRDKLFWFTALDGMLRSDPAVATVRHPANFFAQPTNDELTILSARLDQPGPAVLEQAAAAYSSGLQEISGLLGPVPRRESQVQGFGRLDWQMTERQHLSLEGDGANEDAPSGALRGNSQTFGSHSFGNSQGSDAWGLLKDDSFLTANLLNTAAFEFQRHLQSEAPQAPSAFEAPLIANAWGQLPEIVVDSKYGLILGKPSRLGGSKYPDERIFSAEETLSWVHGMHLIKAGASFDHASDAVNTLTNQTGTYSYVDVLNFLSDNASFRQFGFADINNPNSSQHNCDATGKVHSTEGVLTGLGPLPCYAWFSQRVGPQNWHLSTNQLAAFATEQLQPARTLTLSAGVRVEAEQLPPTMANVANQDLPGTEKLPPTTLIWGPRVGLAWAPWHGTVMRVGAGLYFGRVDNAVVLAALTQTGSLKGDLNLYFKPTDVGAPPFPYVFPAATQTAVVPGAVEFAPNFRVQEVDQAVLSLEQELPSHWSITVNGMTSLGRRLPISIDTNLERALGADGNAQTITYDVVDTLNIGPIKTQKLTVPLYSLRPNANYQQITAINSRANSTYEAALIKLVRTGGHGLSLRAHYLFAHAADWNPNESGQVAGSDVLDPNDFRLEYGTSNLDIRQSGGITLIYQAPWKLNQWAGVVANGWNVASIGQFRSGLPYTLRVGGYIPGYYDTGKLIEGVATSINGSGGDNRLYNIGRNTYRYPATWTGNFRLGKRFNLGENRQLELLAQSFNLFNHQNVTQIETTGYYIDRGTTSGGPATLNFMTGLTKSGLPSTTSAEFGKPLNVNATNFFQPREIELGVKARF